MALPLSYNWKNLVARKTTTVLTLLVIAVVVGVFAWMAGFFYALQHALTVASDSRKLIILKQGSTSETNSAIGNDDFNKLTQLDREIAVEGGRQLTSPEMIVQVSLPRIRDGGQTSANVAVRGVTDMAFAVHRNVRLLGAKPEQGKMELVVGEAAAKQFGGIDVGQTINLGFQGNRAYKIVGKFTADGGPLESEIWGPYTMLRDSYKRDMYSSVAVRLADGIDAADVIKRVEGPAIELTAMTEADYWDSQARNIRIYLGIVGGLVVIMCIAAAFAIANTMFATVAGRTREFAMLRTIGFSGGAVQTCVMIESVLLAALGGAIGCLGCMAYLKLVGGTKDMFGASTFTTLAFDIRLNPMIVGVSLLLVVTVSLIGAMVPARRAAKMHVVSALREA